ncbi:MAG: DUF58 domain-containing protein [Planctomycetota bacterium]
MTEPFPQPFRELLRTILRRAPELRAATDPGVRARRRASSASGTFAGHRDYAPGDDLRAVDWNAYARTGELFIKLLEEEERRVVTILLDRSPSMTTGDPERLLGALRLAAILGGLALVRLDGVRVIYDTSEVTSLSGAAALPRLLDALGRVSAAPQQPLDLLRPLLEAGWLGSVLWISDFADPAAAAPALHLLRRHGRRCSAWLPSLAEDQTTALRGLVRLVDPETGREEVFEADAAMRAAVDAELQRLARHQDSVFAAAGYPLFRYPLPQAGDWRLSSWFLSSWTSGF